MVIPVCVCERKREKRERGGNKQQRELTQMFPFLFEWINRHIAAKNLELEDNQNIILRSSLVA